MPSPSSGPRPRSSASRAESRVTGVFVNAVRVGIRGLHTPEGAAGTRPGGRANGRSTPVRRGVRGREAPRGASAERRRGIVRVAPRRASGTRRSIRWPKNPADSGTGARALEGRGAGPEETWPAPGGQVSRGGSSRSRGPPTGRTTAGRPAHGGRPGARVGQPGKSRGGRRAGARNCPGTLDEERAGASWVIPAITDFRARGTIMGPAGLTAVFGMGTGVAPPVWSPGKASAPAARPARVVDAMSCGSRVDRDLRWGFCGLDNSISGRTGRAGIVSSSIDPGDGCAAWARPPRGVAACGPGWSSRSAVSDRSAATLAGRARPAYRPGGLPGAFSTW